jgi:hypothetical protein
MNKGKYVFAQLLSILPKYEFDKCLAWHKSMFKDVGRRACQLVKGVKKGNRS